VALLNVRFTLSTPSIIASSSKGTVNVLVVSPSANSNVPLVEDFVFNAAFFEHPDETNKKVKLFWIGVGANDKLVQEGSQKLLHSLKSHNIKYEYHESEGGHTWINWRRYLLEVAPKMFPAEGARSRSTN